MYELQPMPAGQSPAPADTSSTVVSPPVEGALGRVVLPEEVVPGTVGRNPEEVARVGLQERDRLERKVESLSLSDKTVVTVHVAYSKNADY